MSLYLQWQLTSNSDSIVTSKGAWMGRMYTFAFWTTVFKYWTVYPPRGIGIMSSSRGAFNLSSSNPPPALNFGYSVNKSSLMSPCAIKLTFLSPKPASKSLALSDASGGSVSSGWLRHTKVWAHVFGTAFLFEPLIT